MREEKEVEKKSRDMEMWKVIKLKGWCLVEGLLHGIFLLLLLVFFCGFITEFFSIIIRIKLILSVILVNYKQLCSV